jgi:hypothetical protein
MTKRLDNVLQLKHRVERLQADLHKAEGAYAQVMQQIRVEFYCRSLTQAERKLARLQKKVESQREEIEQKSQELEGELDKHES